MPYRDPVSEAVFIIQVERFPGTYVLNFVVLVFLLLLVAFTTFLFARDDVKERVGTTLNVYLGVIFFQIMIVERLPSTETPTIMHEFMFYSSVTIMVMTCAHILIWLLDKRVTQEVTARQEVWRMQRSKRLVGAATKLQRAWRRRRIQRFASVGNVDQKPRPESILRTTKVAGFFRTVGVYDYVGTHGRARWDWVRFTLRDYLAKLL